MNEPYDIDVAPNGNVFVSQCGWGRRFEDMDGALGYISKMESLNEKVSSKSLGYSRVFRFGVRRAPAGRTREQQGQDFAIGVQSYSGGTV